MKLTSQQTQTSAGEPVQLFQAGSPFIPRFHTHPAAMTWPGCEQDHGHHLPLELREMQDMLTAEPGPPVCCCAGRWFISICLVSVGTDAASAMPFKSNSVGPTCKAGMPGWKICQPHPCLPGLSLEVPGWQEPPQLQFLPTNLPSLTSSSQTCFKTTGPAKLNLYRKAR